MKDLKFSGSFQYNLNPAKWRHKTIEIFDINQKYNIAIEYLDHHDFNENTPHKPAKKSLARQPTV